MNKLVFISMLIKFQFSNFQLKYEFFDMEDPVFQEFEPIFRNKLMNFLNEKDYYTALLLGLSFEKFTVIEEIVQFPHIRRVYASTQTYEN